MNDLYADLILLRAENNLKESNLGKIDANELYDRFSIFVDEIRPLLRPPVPYPKKVTQADLQEIILEVLKHHEELRMEYAYESLRIDNPTITREYVREVYFQNRDKLD